MNRTVDAYRQSFDTAQEVFDGSIDTADRSRQVLQPENAQASADFLIDSGQDREGFFPVIIDTQALHDDTSSLFINRALLMHNSELGVLSPVVITANPENPGEFQITMLNQPYDPEVGFSDGMHFGISVKAQTRVEGFGGHSSAGGFEQGHFGAVLLGAKDEALADTLVASGDQATHKILDNGVSETMASRKMLDLQPITRQLPKNSAKLQLYWHEGLESENGPIGGDYPDATRLMLGAGVHAIGERGLDRARTLVDVAIRGAQ